MLETYMYSYVHVNPHARVLVDTLFNFIKKRFPWFFGYVVVNFLFQVIFVFLLFLGMVIYADEVETKEK